MRLFWICAPDFAQVRIRYCRMQEQRQGWSGKLRCRNLAGYKDELDRLGINFGTIFGPRLWLNIVPTGLTGRLLDIGCGIFELLHRTLSFR